MLACNHRTLDLQVAFIRCEDAAVDVAFSRTPNIVYIHEKWLDFRTIHMHLECLVGLSAEPPSDEFFCDHVVEELYKRVVVVVFKEVEQLWLTQPMQDRSVSSLSQKCWTKLCQMPRMIRTVPVENGLGILVSWLDGVSRVVSEIYGSQFVYRVVLHDTCCSDQLSQVLYTKSQLSFLLQEIEYC